jgi:hypothetical protein
VGASPDNGGEILTGDRIVLTIPSDKGFEDVAQLVLGGVATRMDLTYESLDDLGTGLATLLERREGDGDLTIELVLGDDTITATIGPFRGSALVSELERAGDGVGLRRVLETVVDSFGAATREDGQWIELQKRVHRVAGS